MTVYWILSDAIGQTYHGVSYFIMFYLWFFKYIVLQMRLRVSVRSHKKFLVRLL